MRNWAIGRINSLFRHVRSLGLRETALYAVQRSRMTRMQKGRRMHLVSKRARHPLLARAGTSDVAVFGQVFRDLEYGCLDDTRQVGLIIDCGANVGYTSAFFLSQFPAATVIAVEPDAENFALLQANLAPYGGRHVLLNTAVWSHRAQLVISEEQWGDGREWARHVRLARPGERAMEAVDIGSLLKSSGFERISILKIDIEGAEAELFSSGYEEWIDRVDNLVIELHGETAETIFQKAISSRSYDFSTSGELTVCRRR